MGAAGPRRLSAWRRALLAAAGRDSLSAWVGPECERGGLTRRRLRPPPSPTRARSSRLASRIRLTKDLDNMLVALGENQPWKTL